MATKKFVYGTDESEVLQGRYPEAYSDVIFGYGGDDTIYGGGYDDFLFGGDGNDWLHGGHGADLLHGGDGSDTASYIIPGYGAQGGVTVNLKTGAAFGGDAAGDILVSIENVEGSSWDDTLIGDDGHNSLYGDAGHDVLVGGDEIDGLYGGADDDWLQGGEGADVLAGDAGIDMANYSDSSEGVAIILGSVKVWGKGYGGSAEGDLLVEIENVTGSLYDDFLSGNDEENELRGAGGNDTLKGGGGADDLHGGGGNDTASYEDSDDSVFVSLLVHTASGGTAQDDTFNSIENLTGSTYGDFLNGDDGVNTLTGLEGGDHLTGYLGDDTLLGGSGGDYLQGGGGADLIDGGSGIDTASYTQSPGGVSVALDTGTGFLSDAQGDLLTDIENLTGSFHDDQLQGNDDVNKLEGRDGDDALKGFGGDDTLDGEKGADWLDGGAGADDLDGGAGDDILRYATGGAIDTLNGGDDTDTADFSSFDSAVWVDLLYSGVEAWTSNTSVATELTSNTQIANLDNIENVIGTSGTDLVWGSAGDNVYRFTGHASGTYDYFDGRGGNDTADFSLCGTAVWVDLDYAGIEAWSSLTAANEQIADLDNVENIVGSAFDDVLIGDSGANVIAGGYGNDQLTGGAGPDAFVFNKALNAATNVDQVTDFNVADDVIHLDRAVFSSLKPGVLKEGAFVVGSAAGDANDHIVYNSATGALLYDADGDGADAAVQFAQLGTGLALTSADFLVV